MQAWRSQHLSQASTPVSKPQPETLLIKRLRHKSFSVNFVKILEQFFAKDFQAPASIIDILKFTLFNQCSTSIPLSFCYWKFYNFTFHKKWYCLVLFMIKLEHVHLDISHFNLVFSFQALSRYFYSRNNILENFSLHFSVTLNVEYWICFCLTHYSPVLLFYTP